MKLFVCWKGSKHCAPAQANQASVSPCLKRHSVRTGTWTRGRRVIPFPTFGITRALLFPRCYCSPTLLPHAQAVPSAFQLALRERAAKNHLTIVAASRADSPIPRGAMIATVPRFPARWRGRLNPADTAEAAPGIETFVVQTIDPVASRNKVMLPKTDAIFNRRAELHGPLAAAQPG